MMNIMSYILKKARAFRRDETGTATIEFVIIFPILAWSIVAMAVYFDAFRVKSVNLKAAYTISDMLSRENPIIDQAYLDGLKTTFDFLVASNNPTTVRITLVQFETNDPDDPGDDEHLFQYSEVSGSIPPLTQGTLSEIENQIPIMGDGDSVMIVETHMNYVPTFNIGIDPYDLNTLIVTRPRFPPPCWETCIN